SARDRIEIPGLDELWKRRDVMDAAGLRIPAFCQRDRLTIAALHLLRHILRNNMRPSQAWEVHRMMQRSACALSMLEAISRRFCETWFNVGSRTELPAKIEEWFAGSAWSPVTNIVEPNKDVLALHLLLLESWGDRAAVLKRRLAPTRLPSRDEAQ